MTNIIGILTLTTTAIYAILTYYILKASKEQLNAIFRPYISITHKLTHKTTIKLYIKNTGKSNAKNLRLIIDKDFYQLKGKQNNIAEHFAFNNVIETFPPDAQLTFALMSSVQLYSDSIDEKTQSPVFSITANYSYADKEISEKTVIDLRSYKSTFMPDYSIEERLEILTEEIIKLNDNVKQLAG